MIRRRGRSAQEMAVPHQLGPDPAVIVQPLVPGDRRTWISCGARRRWTVDDGRNTRADAIEVVSKVVNEGGGRSFLASLDSFDNAGVVTFVCSLLI